MGRTRWSFVLDVLVQYIFSFTRYKIKVTTMASEYVLKEEEYGNNCNLQKISGYTRGDSSYNGIYIDGVIPSHSCGK